MHGNRTFRLGSMHTVLVCVLLAFAGVCGALWVEVDSSHASEGSHGALARPKHPQPAAAKAERLNELMRLRITNVKGKKVSARGSASGTISGSVSFKLILSSASHARAEFSGSNSSGRIDGGGAASYRVAGAVSYFSGTVTSMRGGGRYAHAYSLGVQFSGTVNRKTYEVTLRLNGRWHV